MAEQEQWLARLRAVRGPELREHWEHLRRTRDEETYARHVRTSLNAEIEGGRRALAGLFPDEAPMPEAPEDRLDVMAAVRAGNLAGSIEHGWRWMVEHNATAAAVTAKREVLEDRPIGHGPGGGWRYYRSVLEFGRAEDEFTRQAWHDRKGDAWPWVPPDYYPRTVRDGVDAAVWLACRAFQGSDDRWQVRATIGQTDQQLAAALEKEIHVHGQTVPRYGMEYHSLGVTDLDSAEADRRVRSSPVVTIRPQTWAIWWVNRDWPGFEEKGSGASDAVFFVGDSLTPADVWGTAHAARETKLRGPVLLSRVRRIFAVGAPQGIGGAAAYENPDGQLGIL